MRLQRTFDKQIDVKIKIVQDIYTSQIKKKKKLKNKIKRTQSIVDEFAKKIDDLSMNELKNDIASISNANLKTFKLTFIDEKLDEYRECKLS